MTGILLIHGAWHGPWCWNEFATRLAKRGHDVRAVELRRTIPDPSRWPIVAYQQEPIIFPGMGHDMMLDGGWQKVADCVNVWVGERQAMGQVRGQA